MANELSFSISEAGRVFSSAAGVNDHTYETGPVTFDRADVSMRS